MNQDIDGALRGWDFKPGMIQARLVQARDGRQVIQMRVDLGVLQIETANRPDGVRPHGCTTYFDYLKQQARVADRAGQVFILSEEQCEEANQEFAQYYQRRLCWWALRNYARVIEDADHTLAFMDFVRDHSPSDEYTQNHEQYRGFVVFQRTQASAALAVEHDDAEAALNAIREGLEGLRRIFAAYDAEEQMEQDGMVQQLRQMDRSLRKKHNIEATLREQLDEAVAREEYELAAELRDKLHRRAEG
jgi:UvrB/uvrC motif